MNFLVAEAAIWPPMMTLSIWLLLRRSGVLRRQDWGIPWIWFCAAMGTLIPDLVAACWPAVAVSLPQVLLALWWFRRRRKGRRKAAALLGAKSRALRDALVRRAREAARPRPVLRPVPQGAR